MERSEDLKQVRDLRLVRDERDREVEAEAGRRAGNAVLTTFMVLSGISGILRSLDREKARQDRDEDRDERTRYNTYRSRALTFRVLFCLNFVILAGCFIGWWRSGEQEVYIQTAVPCMVLFIVGWITRIASDFYYEFKG